VPYDEESHGDKPEGIERNAAPPGPARLEPEAVVERDSLMEAIDDVVSDDPDERAVMVERLRGLKAKEIQQKLGLTPQQYESVMKRITYHARKTGVAEDLR
jgi:DNA-directed RNA polymerase specialized sigma24 family protein